MLSYSRLAVLMVVLILHDNGHAGRIIGGHETEPHSRPYMVLLERTMENGGKRFCGGFLLNEDFMMTAAHCHAKTYVAVLGVNNRHQRNESQRAEVEQAFPHKDYKNSTYDNDLMILKFRSKVKLCHNVKPIDLADSNIRSLPSSCSVSGWGQTDWQKNFITDKLMEINVTLIDDDDFFKEHNYCSKEMIGPGQGDSGGPLVCEEGKVYGVVSSMYRDNSTGSAMFYYTKIPDYKDWINSILKKA